MHWERPSSCWRLHDVNGFDREGAARWTMVSHYLLISRRRTIVLVVRRCGSPSPQLKRVKWYLFRVDYRLSRINEQRLWALYMIRPRTQHIASRHARPGRGAVVAARDADAPTSRNKPSWGFGRDLGVSERLVMPHERVAFDPSQHLPPSRAHATDHGADRARDALKIREGRLKRKRDTSVHKVRRPFQQHKTWKGSLSLES